MSLRRRSVESTTESAYLVPKQMTQFKKKKKDSVKQVGTLSVSMNVIFDKACCGRNIADKNSETMVKFIMWYSMSTTHAFKTSS